MASRAQHYREAERLLDELPELPPKPSPMDLERRILAVGEARAHAQLAAIGDRAYSEYLDLMSLEHAREEVASTPDAVSRAWLYEDEQADDDDG